MASCPACGPIIFPNISPYFSSLSPSRLSIYVSRPYTCLFSPYIYRHRNCWRDSSPARGPTRISLISPLSPLNRFVNLETASGAYTLYSAIPSPNRASSLLIYTIFRQARIIFRHLLLQHQQQHLFTVTPSSNLLAILLYLFFRPCFSVWSYHPHGLFQIQIHLLTAPGYICVVNILGLSLPPESLLCTCMGLSVAVISITHRHHPIDSMSYTPL